MNYNPPSRLVFEVVERFKSVLPFAVSEENLEMRQISLLKDSCGTIACHAGWYLFAKRFLKERFYYRDSRYSDEFLKGVVAMNNDLGFKKSVNLLTGLLIRRYCIGQIKIVKYGEI